MKKNNFVSAFDAKVVVSRAVHQYRFLKYNGTGQIPKYIILSFVLSNNES